MLEERREVPDPPIILRSRDAMSGTDIPLSGSGLRTCYAKSGTDVGYGATRNKKSRRLSCRTSLQWRRCTKKRVISLRARYGMSGTDRGYGGTGVWLPPGAVQKAAQFQYLPP
eukprot:1923228-Rhodomonas_salina.6